jgi:hypothetical protein
MQLNEITHTDRIVELAKALGLHAYPTPRCAVLTLTYLASGLARELPERDRHLIAAAFVDEAMTLTRYELMN